VGVGVGVTANLLNRSQFSKMQSNSTNTNAQQKDHSLHEKAHTVIGSSTITNVSSSAMNTATGAGASSAAGAASFNVRDLAKKLNNNVEKKSNFRPSWLKTKPTSQPPLLLVPNSNNSLNGNGNSIGNINGNDKDKDCNVPDTDKKEDQHSSPTTTATTNISNSSNNDANANDDQLARHVQPHLQSQKQKQKQTQKQHQTPPKKQQEQEGVLHKAHFWRTQTTQRISPKRERIASPLVIKYSQPQPQPSQNILPIHTDQEIPTSTLLQTPSRHPFGKTVQDMERRRVSKSPEYIQKHKHLQKKEEKQEFVSPSPEKEPNGLYTNTRTGTSRENARISPRKFTPKKLQFDEGFREGDGDKDGNGKQLQSQPQPVVLVDERSNSVNLNVQEEKTQNNATDAMASQRASSLTSPSDAKSSFQSRIAQFSIKSPASTLSSTAASFQRKNAISEGIAVTESMSMSMNSRKKGASKDVSEEEEPLPKKEKDAHPTNENEGVKQEESSSSSSHFWKNQIKSRRTTTTNNPLRDDKEEGSDHGNPVRISEEIQKDNIHDRSKVEPILGRVSFAEALEETNSPPMNNEEHDTDTNTKQNENENKGGVSKKAQFWVNHQKNKEGTISTRGRNFVASSRSRSLSQRRSCVKHTEAVAPLQPASTNALSENSFSNSKRSPSLPPPIRPDQADTAQTKRVQSKDETLSTSVAGEASSDKNEYMQYMSRNRRSRSKIDQPKVQSNFIANEDSADIEDNEDFRNLIKSSMNKKDAVRKSLRKWPPAPQNETETEISGSLEVKEVITQDEGPSANIMVASPPRMSALETAALSPVKSRWTPRNAETNTSTTNKVRKPEEKLGMKQHKNEVPLSSSNNAIRIRAEDKEMDSTAPQPVGQSNMYTNEYARHTPRNRQDITTSTPKIDSSWDESHSPLKSRWTPRNAETNTSTTNEVRKPEEKLGIKQHKNELLPSSNSHLTETSSNSASRIRAEDKEMNRDATQPVGQSNMYGSEYAQHQVRNRQDNITSALKADSSSDESHSPLNSRWTPRNTETKTSTRNEVYKPEENLGAKLHKNDIKVSSNSHLTETASNSASRIRAKDEGTDIELSQPVGQSTMYTSEYAQHKLRNRRDNTATALEADLSSEGSALVTSNQKVSNKSKFSWPPSESSKTQDTAATIQATPKRAETATSVVETSNFVMTPRTAAPAATKTAEKEGDIPSETPIRHNISSMSSPLSPSKADRHEEASENATVITDTSSFLSVREVKKRLWDEGEKLKMWQKGDEHRSAENKPSDDDKQSSLFKSRFYRAAEVAQKNCKENSNSIPTPTNHQSVTKRDTIQPFDISKGKDKIQDKAKDKAVAQLLARLSSVKRDDPDEALRAIDSILEKHSGNNSPNKGFDQDEVNKSAESPILPAEYFDEDEQAVRKEDEEESSEYSDSDDSTVSSITNPTYMSGFGDCSPKSRKQQFGHGRLKPAHHSARPSSFLVKAAHPYSQRNPSELPPRRPHQPVPVSRTVKPLAGLQSTVKSRISRKSPSPPPPPSAFPKTKPMVENHSKDPFEDKAFASTPRSTNVKRAKPTSPVKTLSAGGSSSNNRGLLNKFKDWGSDSDDKEDIGRPHEQKQNPGSPSERLKKLADAAQKLNNGQQSPIRNKERRFLYPKRDPPPDETRSQGGKAVGTTTSSDNDAAWFPTESANFFRGEFFELERKSGKDPAAVEDIFDPFMEPLKGNNAFANEVLAEKFSRMEKAYQQ